MDVLKEVLQKTSQKDRNYSTVEVKKPLNLDYDLGALMAADTNELEESLLRTQKNDYILKLTRENVQLLFNQIWCLPTEKIEDTIVAKLPARRYVLPRFKTIPKPKSLTKWQQFAKDKGIQKKKRSKLSWDEQLQKWVPLFGLKKMKAQREKEWILEVPQNSDPMEDQFAKKAVAKGERIAKNELQRLRNIAKVRNVKVPRVGLTDSDISSAKDLQTAVTVARSSTASLGKFQNKLPKETDAKGVSAITPGATRKRKLAPVSGNQEKSENLSIVESILSKRPKLDIEKAAAKQINQEQLQRSEDKHNERSRSRKDNKKRQISKGPRNAKKPKSGKGQRKGKSGGRKRR